MNIQEYISSGILESYVFGNTSPEESKEVENYAAAYPEIKKELAEIEKTMNAYATEHSVTPPLYLKEKVLERVMGEAESALPAGNIRTLYKEAGRDLKFSYRLMAAVLVFLVSTGFAIYFGVKNSELSRSIGAMAKANAALTDSIKAISSNMSQMESDLAILKDPMYKIVELKGQKAAPEAKAMVCWCPMEKKVYVEIEKLPQPPQGMQYQLWAIVDGKPVSEGMLSMGSGLHRMPDIDKAQAFAVTLEKAGGSVTPKGDMYVMGAI